MYVQKMIIVLIALNFSLISAFHVQSRPADEVADRIEWLVDNGTSLRTIDMADDDFSDLLPLADAIGNSRIVLLGEQTHGDGVVFQMKCRLVRFLHEIMGFDVLAWESGLYDCRQMEAALHTDLPLPHVIPRGVFSIWGKSDQVRPVFEYVRTTYDTVHPLEMAGLDCQFTAYSSGNTFLTDLFSFLGRLKDQALSAADQALFLRAFYWATFTSLSPEERKINKKNIKRLQDLIQDNQALLEQNKSRREIAFWKRVVANLGIQMQFMENRMDKQKTSSTRTCNLRDMALGQTLGSLVNEVYPNRKIIVWAASSHIMRNASEIWGRGRLSGKPYLKYEGSKRMGDWVFEEFGSEAYSIAFTAYEGEAGCWMWPEAIHIPEAAEGTLDHFLYMTGQEYLFVDFRQLQNQPDHWLHQEIETRPIGHHPLKTNWTKHFDGLIFTRHMEPSRLHVPDDNAEK